MSKRMLLPALAAAGAFALLAASLSVETTRDAEAQEEAAIEATMQAAVSAWNSHDVANFISRWTDQGFEAEFGFSKSDIAQVSEIIGEPPIVEFSVENIEIGEDTATADITLSFSAFADFSTYTFVFDGNRWQIDDTMSRAPEIPAGATVVDVQLDEYEFIYDQAAAAAGGNLAFAIENVGEEAHEFVLVQITSDAPLLDLLASEEEEPEGVEFLTFAEADPGESTAALLPGPLEAGRYGIVCFFPAPDGTPHAFLGMVSEFNVGGAAPITPPSTGSGGLADGGSGSLSQALLMLAGVLALVAVGSLAPVLRR